MIGRTLGGATVPVLQGALIVVVTLIAGFRPVSVLAVPLAFLLIALIAVVFAALATAIGSTIKEMQGFQMVMNFLVMPLFFLSGALYPLVGLPWVLAALTRVDPLTYGVDGMRGLLIGRGSAHFGLGVDVAVLLGVGSCSWPPGRGGFRRSRRREQPFTGFRCRTAKQPDPTCFSDCRSLPPSRSSARLLVAHPGGPIRHRSRRRRLPRYAPLSRPRSTGATTMPCGARPPRSRNSWSGGPARAARRSCRPKRRSPMTRAS